MSDVQEPSGSIILRENPTATTWWIHDEGEAVYLVVETDHGRQVSFDITNAHSPGVIREASDDE